MIARDRFIAAAALAYARMSRPGSGRRASGVGSSPLTMSPRYDGRPATSVAELRGLAYWPAMRATLTTGIEVPYVNTTAI